MYFNYIHDENMDRRDRDRMVVGVKYHNDNPNTIS
jgi:hypothetical protein